MLHAVVRNQVRRELYQAGKSKVYLAVSTGTTNNSHKDFRTERYPPGKHRRKENHTSQTGASKQAYSGADAAQTARMAGTGCRRPAAAGQRPCGWGITGGAAAREMPAIEALLVFATTCNEYCSGDSRPPSAYAPPLAPARAAAASAGTRGSGSRNYIRNC